MLAGTAVFAIDNEMRLYRRFLRPKGFNRLEIDLLLLHIVSVFVAVLKVRASRPLEKISALPEGAISHNVGRRAIEYSPYPSRK